MFRRIDWCVFLFFSVLCNSPVHAEYCLDWSSFVSKHSGSSGHCWPTEQECNSYRFSRPAGDYVGGCYYRAGSYPPTGKSKAGNANKTNDQAAKSAEEQKKKQEAQQREAAQQRTIFEKDKQQLMGGLKGALPFEPANNITLKPIPPAGGLARSQLDCIARNDPDRTPSELDKTRNDADKKWTQRATDCSPADQRIPEPPKPTRVETPADPATLAKFLESLGQQISTVRGSLTKQDQEIAAKEHEIAQEELKIADPNKPKTESEALRRAREALAKAKADRARTAAELAKLEQQESAAKNQTSPQ